MMKSRLVKNLSANATQLIVNQVFGFGVFYILSRGLDKYDFGQINLVLAILLAVFNILSFGIDQLIVKKIAAGVEISSIISIYIFHVLLTGFVFYGILAVGYFLFHSDNYTFNLLLLIGIGKTMLFFSTPLKQVANGLEKFKLLAYMSVGSNILRCVGVVVFYLIYHLSIFTIVSVFIFGDVAETLICIYLFNKYVKIGVNIKWDRTGYSNLLRESLPQTGVVLITSALARFDWIFIGFMVSAISLAEYSFAYKIFEIATLPLLAIAPILIPRFTKLFQQTDLRVTELKTLLRIEMVIAALVPLILNICWAPVIDGITSGKYGAINVNTIFILSLCMPFLYINNFLWTIFFAQGRLKTILVSFVITLLVNVGFDIILIPIFKNEGAAFAFLLACVVQTIFYLKKNNVANLIRLWVPLIVCITDALISGFAARFLFTNCWLALPVTIVFYMALIFLSGQIKLSDRRSFTALFN
jgi:O-antigen/teichoic acid export membrane protein